MNKYFVDLHVHIGRSSDGREIKKATSNNLTFENIAYESYYRKGIQVIGVVDCISPYVIKDIENLMERAELTEKKDGGMEYHKEQTILLGQEIETHEKTRGSAHSLCFFPKLEQIKSFSNEMKKHIKNIDVFACMSRLTGQELFNIVDYHGGIFIPAHVFTPHKSFYGSSADSLTKIFNEKSLAKIPSVELGLSADAFMASMLSELDNKTFLSNSDAHSLPKMGREYNIFELKSPTFSEVLKALKNEDKRKVVANYGLNPRLGKYNRSYCLSCDKVIDEKSPVLKCPISQKHRVVVGVADRIDIIKDRDTYFMKNRPPYYYQIPLDFIPKIGPKTIDILIENFGTEMKILHETSFEELSKVINPGLATGIILAREGNLNIEAGGGGIYGKIE